MTALQFRPRSDGLTSVIPRTPCPLAQQSLAAARGAGKCTDFETKVHGFRIGSARILDAERITDFGRREARGARRGAEV